MAQTGQFNPQPIQEEAGGSRRNTAYRKNRLRQLPDCYKIKLKTSGYRLIYQVIDSELIVWVVAIGRRERNEAYDKAGNRLPR